MKKAFIGITTGLNMYTSGGFQGSYRVYVVSNYVESVIRAGGVPILIPACSTESDTSYVSQIMDSLDGIIVTGGNDVDPAVYGEEPCQTLHEIAPERDVQDKLVLEAAVKRNIGVLGICRGMQFINAFFGGTLYQDLSKCSSAVIKHTPIKTLDVPVHNIDVVEGSFLYRVLGERHRVNSAHHQLLKDVAPCMRVTASAPDSVVEAIEHRDFPNIIGVQFHPEMMSHKDKKMQGIFDAFVSDCSK